VFVRGLLTTLIVVASIELLALGETGVGWLNGAIGAGGFVGALASLALAGRSRLAPAFALALVGWGAPIALIGAIPVAWLGIAALVVVGTSNALLDVAGFTLLQRVTPNRSRGAVFQLLEGGIGLGVAAGGIVAPLLIELAGVRGALVATGVVLPVVALVTWSRVERLDREAVVPTRELGLLRGIPLFAPLPLTAIERLASSLQAVDVATGERLIREGEIGDRYYVVATGELDVTREGIRLRTCGPGAGVGEIALLRRVPRTATVTATRPTSLLALEAADFLAAVTGHSGSGAAAERVIVERLTRSSAVAEGVDPAG
jgi:MFS family permease